MSGFPGSGRSGWVETSIGAAGISFEGFDETAVVMAGLMGRVRRAVSEGSSLAVLEEEVREDLLEVGRAVVQDGLNAVSAAQVRRDDVIGPEGLVRPWAAARRARRLVTLFGAVTFSRIAYRGPGVPDVFPADEQLDLPVSSCFSRAVEQRVGYLSAKTAYEQVADLVKWETGTTIGTRQLRQIAARAGADTEAFAQIRAVPEVPEDGEGEPQGRARAAREGSMEGPPVDDAGRVLVATFDGKGVVMRPEARRTASGHSDPGVARGAAGLPGHGQQPGRRRGRKRLAELSCIYDIRLAPRTPEQVLASLTHAPATTSPRTTTPTQGQIAGGDPTGPQASHPAPRARERWLQASLTAPIEQVVADGFAQADRRDPDHHWGWIALVDANKTQIDAITAQATARGAKIPILIDLLHVLGYLWDAANATFNPGAPAAADWVAAQTRALLEGHPTQVVAEIRDRATRFHPTDNAKEKILAAATYLDNHLDQLDYPTALARGWPIATGVIEGACRHLEAR